MSHRLQKDWRQSLRDNVPFGLGRAKPHHFRDMAKVAWKNRDSLPYAWKVLTQGVCDGCALGTTGLRDWTIDGVHLCMTRLNLLRLNTMPALDIRRLEDVERLRTLANDQLRELGRLPHPMLRERGERGFRRISWEDAYARVAHRIRSSEARRLAFYLTSRAHHQRNVLRGTEGRALSRHEQRRQRRSSLPFPVDGGDEARARRRRDHLQLPRLVGQRSHRLFRRQPRQRPACDDQVPGRSQAPRHSSRHGESVPRAGHGTLLGAFDGAQRDFRYRHRRPLVQRLARRRHRVPVRSAQGPDRPALVRRVLREQSHQRLRETPRGGRADGLVGPRAAVGPGADEHGGVRRLDPRREYGGPRVEHGDHAARLRRSGRPDDPEPRLDEGLRRPGALRADADPRAFGRAGRRRNGRLCNRLSGRQADLLRHGAASCPRTTGSTSPTVPVSRRRKWWRRRHAASSICCTASAETSFALCPIRTTSRAPWRTCPCACTRISS